jgi:hypothetical protein
LAVLVIGWLCVKDGSGILFLLPYMAKKDIMDSLTHFCYLKAKVGNAQNNLVKHFP